MKATKTERAYDNDPTPDETAEYFRDAVSTLYEQFYDELNANKPRLPWDVMAEQIDQRITMRAIKSLMVERMAKANEAFSSAYRHEVSPAHSLWYSILGSTVGMNHRIADVRAGKTREQP